MKGYAKEFTREYFMDEVRKFFELCGTTDFWDLPLEQQEGAVKGLSYCYFNTDHGEDLETDAKMLDMAIENYTRRAVLVAYLDENPYPGPDDETIYNADTGFEEVIPECSKS